jgi:elongation factor Ts
MSNTEMIKELRALTQAGMKDCKESLEEANWDLQKAVDIVKTKGLNIVSGREGKVASEGAVSISKIGDVYAMVEVNCQTDFVANSSAFIDFIDHTAMTLAERVATDHPFSVDDVKSQRESLISTTKENVVVRRWWVEQSMVAQARTFTYVHPNYKIGVLLTLMAPTEEAAKSPEFSELGNDLVMQVAAMNPLAVSVDKLDPAVLARQKAIFEAQLAELNKPQAAWPRILEGKLNKWHTEVCLLNQESVVIPKSTIQQVIKNVGTKLGGEVQVVTFMRCQVGEGIETQKINLADEVAKMMVPLDSGILK